MLFTMMQQDEPTIMAEPFQANAVAVKKATQAVLQKWLLCMNTVAMVLGKSDGPTLPNEKAITLRAPRPDRAPLAVAVSSRKRRRTGRVGGVGAAQEALQYMKRWDTAIECAWQVVTVGAKSVEQQGLKQLIGMQEWSALVFFLDGTPTQMSAVAMLKEFSAVKVREVVFEAKVPMLKFHE